MGATAASRILKERHFMDHLHLRISRLLLRRTMWDPLRSLWAALTLTGGQYNLRCFLYWLGFFNHLWSVHSLLRSRGHIMRYVLFFEKLGVTTFFFIMPANARPLVSCPHDGRIHRRQSVVQGTRRPCHRMCHSRLCSWGNVLLTCPPRTLQQI